MHAHDGQQYGPITKTELDQWVADGLISAECQLRQADGDWQFAAAVYSHDSPAPSAPVSPAKPPPGYQPVLTRIKGNATLASTFVGRALPSLNRGNAITRSEIYQVGAARTFWEKAKAGTTIGPFPVASEVHIDQLHLMTISDPAGEFHVVAPFDNGHLCPIEFFSVLPGKLPTSLALLRGEGGNWGVDVATSTAGAFVPYFYRAMMREMGGQPKAYWAVLDPDESQSAAEFTNQYPQLFENLRFDGTIAMGHIEITYRLNWAVQALPLDQDHYLLVAQFIPAGKALGMLGFDLGVAWFVQWREQFAALAPHLPADGDGRFCCLDYGIWGTVAYEVLGLDVV